jgi:hypothetical protein
MLTWTAKHRTLHFAAIISCYEFGLYRCVSQNRTSKEPVATEAQIREAPALASVHEAKLIRRPGNSPQDSKVYIVRNGKKQWVGKASWFAANGYHFPEEVVEIPASDLASPATGDPIQ